MSAVRVNVTAPLGSRSRAFATSAKAAPPFTRAASALAGLDPTGTAGLLNRLIAASLLDEHRPGRYALHDLLRSYAAEQARDQANGHETEAMHRLYDYYLQHTLAAAQMLYPQVVRLGRPSAPAT